MVSSRLYSNCKFKEFIKCMAYLFFLSIPETSILVSIIILTGILLCQSFPDCLQLFV